jgi:hypothetical protein
MSDFSSFCKNKNRLEIFLFTFIMNFETFYIKINIIYFSVSDALKENQQNTESSLWMIEF